MFSILLGIKQSCLFCLRIIFEALRREGIFNFIEFISPILSVKPGHSNTENKKAGVKGKPFLILSSELDKAVRKNIFFFLSAHCFAVIGSKYFRI